MPSDEKSSRSPLDQVSLNKKSKTDKKQKFRTKSRIIRQKAKRTKSNGQKAKVSDKKQNSRTKSKTDKKQRTKSKSVGQKAKLSDKKQKRTKSELRTNSTVSDARFVFKRLISDA